MTMTQPSETLLAVEPEAIDGRVAVIGLAGRFPGSENVRDFWDALERGESGLTLAPETRPGLTAARFALKDKACFDAAFFGFTPAEAALMDPQHRVFLETAWHAMEDAGYGAGQDGPRTGVFAAAGFNDYVLKHVGPRSYAESAAEYFAMLIGNDKDFLASRVAYLLDLKGPATVVQSACSSGLLCVHEGVQALLQGEVDMALAGAVSISMDIENGYHADPGGPMSPTGRIAPFSADANGIVGGNGVAAVVLKRLEDALADRDNIYAVIDATAANNDGRERANFTAPGVAGQRRALAEALSLSGLLPADVDYIEAHGTGTPIGDPIEVDAIRQVYGAAQPPCLIGSVKGNVGHLNTVAGLAGLLKAIHVVRTGIVPPTLNFTGVNSLLQLQDSRFSICDRLTRLKGKQRYCAAVSSFGFGGTNVHAIISSPPAAADAREDAGGGTPVLLCWSAKDPAGLERLDASLSAFWSKPSEASLRDEAGSLLAGRRHLRHRHAVVARNRQEAASRIAAGPLSSSGEKPGDVAFLFPGQGTQFAGMGRQLYERFPAYRQGIDACARLINPILGGDIRDLMHGTCADALKQTQNTQLSLFSVGYALAQCLLAAGVKPAALLGHSIGEYTAACIAGVFPLEDAVRLVHARGLLMSGLPRAAMLSVHCPAGTVADHLGEDLSLAVINRSDRCVISGEGEALAALAARLEAAGIASRPLEVSHGFHSHLMDPILPDFEKVCQTVSFSRPSIPVFSNTSGGLADGAEIGTASYWVRHLRQTVRFSGNIEALAAHWPGVTCLELGPGTSCMSAIGASGTGLSAIPAMAGEASETEDFLALLGRLWTGNHDLDPALLLPGGGWRRASLPGYPFDRTLHLLPPAGAPESRAAADKALPFEDWFHVPAWKTKALARLPAQADRAPLIVFSDKDSRYDPDAVRICPADAFSENADGSFGLRPGDLSGFQKLAAALKARGIENATCLFAWPYVSPADSAFGHDSLVRLAQSLLRDGCIAHLVLATRELASISGAEAGSREQARALGVLRAIPFETGGIPASWVDCDELPDRDMLARAGLLRRQSPGLHALSLGLRRGRIWSRSIERVSMPAAGLAETIRAHGTYLITGATGGLGLQLVRQLAQRHCHLILIARNLDPELIADPSRHPVFAECIAAGARLTLIRGQADDRKMLDGIAADIAGRSGALDGIFHLAGRYVTQTLQDMTLDGSDTNRIAKIAASEALIDVFSPLSPGFMVSFSSLAGETSGYGNSDYIASNLYLDHQAETQDAPFPIISVAWDNWEKLGAFGEAVSASGSQTLFMGQDALAIGVEPGFAALWRILASGLPRVIVTTSDVARRLEAASDAARARFERAAQPVSTTVTARQGSPLEQVVLGLFGEILGIGDITLRDDFLQLGGDSITAVRLLSKLRRIFQAELSLPDFLTNRTPAQLAARLSAIDGTADTALAYLHIQGLSGAERQALRAGRA